MASDMLEHNSSLKVQDGDQLDDWQLTGRG
jgi:predicted membrane GTPase involved in stress response